MLPQWGSFDGAFSPRFSTVERGWFSWTYQVGTETVKSCRGFGPSLMWVFTWLFPSTFEDMRYDRPSAIFHFLFRGVWMLSSLGIASWPGWIVFSHWNRNSMSTNWRALVISRVCTISCSGSTGWTGIQVVPGLVPRYFIIDGSWRIGRYSLVLFPVLLRNPYL